MKTLNIYRKEHTHTHKELCSSRAEKKQQKKKTKQNENYIIFESANK